MMIVMSMMMISMMVMILMTRLVDGVRSLRICNRSNITKPGRHFGEGEHGRDGGDGGGGGGCLVGGEFCHKKQHHKAWQTFWGR